MKPTSQTTASSSSANTPEASTPEVSAPEQSAAAVQPAQGFTQSARFVITIAAIGVAIYFLNSFRDLFNAFFLAQLVVLTASPAMYWLHERKMPGWLSVSVGLLLALAITLLIAGAILISAARMVEMLPLLREGLNRFLLLLQATSDQYGIDLDQLLALVNTPQLMRLAATVLQSVLSSVSVFSLMLLILVFMVIEAITFPAKVDRQLKRGNRQFANLFGYTENMRQYLSITSLLGVAGGVVAAAALVWMGVNFALIWGVLYFVMNFVPLVGFWIAMLPPLLIAATTLGAPQAAAVFLIYAVMSAIINQGLRPALMRSGLDLSPLWSILSLVVWSAILGPAGLIIGIPLTIAIKELLLENDPESRWLAELLSADVPAAVPLAVDETELLNDQKQE